MFTLTQVLIPVALLSSVVISLPLAEDNIFDGLAKYLPTDQPHYPLNENERIYGGQEATIGQYPHQISLRLNETTVFEHHCGGSIITNRFVVTAGHCYIASLPQLELYRVVVGAHQRDGQDGIVHNVQQFIVHERFLVNRTQHKLIVINDIGLIQTVSIIEFNNLVAPISLHRKFFNGGASAVTSGWGRSNDAITNLKALNVTTVTNDECRRMLRDVGARGSPVHDFETICAFSGKIDHGTSYGDSGGPLVSENKLIGIVSWGYGVAEGAPDGYTRVSLYVDWVEEKIESTLWNSL